MTYKTIINIQIDKFTSVIVIAIHFVTPIQRDRTRYDWFSIWKSYLSLLFLVIIVGICAKAAHRINRYCLKRVSDVTFSKNNGSNGLNLKTMEMRCRPSLVLTFRPVKIHKWCQKWALCAMINRKSDTIPVSRTIFFRDKFSIWPLVAILNFDVWARQNARNDTRK